MADTDCLHEAFSRRAAQSPRRVAVSCGTEQITYAELDARSTVLAERLRRCGVGRGSRVGVCVDRSICLVVTVLAVVKAGAAYVPVDPENPAGRVAHVLSDSEVALTVAAIRTADALADWSGPVLWSDADESDDPTAVEAPSEAAEPSDVAYVIYTSGSTGAPKGVEVEHRSAVALLERAGELYEFDELDVWTMFHSVGFDFSVWEMWGALLFGCKLVVVPAQVTRTPALMLDLLRRERVTVLSQTPSAFRGLVAADAAAGPPAELSLRLVVFGGERLDVAVLAPWIGRRGDSSPVLVNMYGITEITVHATHRRITAADLEHPSVSPIGVALPGLRVEPRTADGRPVPDGEPGELFVAGTGVARGYLNRPELTAQRFVVLDGQRWYRSGDSAALVDGELVYLGRVDRQLKVRGYRVEPGEVEARLLSCARVGTALVTARDFGDGDVRLVAYVAPPPAPDPVAPTEAELTAAVADLPGYLRPSRFHVVDDIPVTAQGKADVDALVALTETRPATVAAHTAADPTATAVKAIVDEVLVRDVPVDGDLFDHGATSLSLARVIAMVNNRFDLALTGAELEEPTIACLSDVVGSTRRPGALQEVGG
ncbi:non-ribosomal peptide synthetase [Actinosynnema sp. NPDC047251]|uniref:Amino acid adenylation domain-containing protein n=1 Tax=Saccharothrix espanaensis (strain ATCC 51144 / DSM 44229 / JCM 9112 / NBRC 15066 / NRRL 15764) TaxID=1179773 RepID=K0K2Q7_SACES|nr:non-ribosomal peptide synthetase [Saccharothrix espanaensis]CCH31882.1 Amino acid adenylation domain-containing protein [Saccharothrix espanaensis DSM 44229]